MCRRKSPRISGKQVEPMSLTDSELVSIASMRIRALASPVSWAESRQQALARIGRRIGLTARQARRIVDEEVISIGARVWLALESEWLAEQSRMEAAADLMQERARAARARGGYAHDLLDERPTTHLFGTGGEPVPAGGTAGIENSGPEEA